jgi:glycine hydroxymethyltransferase
MKEDAYWIRDQVQQHNKWFEESIPMIASENLMSPLAKEMMISDFHDRYAEGLPGKRYYNGNIFVDKVEIKCLELAQRIFKCQFADVRPISGTVANMAALMALMQPGETMTCTSLDHGAHISTAKFGAVGLRGVNTATYPFDTHDMVIDVDGAAKLIREVRPKVVQFGLSVFLFPAPIKELKDVAAEVNAPIWYDGAHVLGLIAGGKFQDPLHEGANVLTASTHKTFPGPNHGIVLGHNLNEDLSKKLNSAVFPGVTSSHHLHAMAALAVTMAEWEIFGEKYAAQVCKNAKALGQALHELGIEVLCAHKGFTESHTIAVNVAPYGGGAEAANLMERANMIANKNMLPGDKSSVKPSGIRLGAQEMTRVGMRESEMKEVAALIYRVVVKKESPEAVRKDVIALKRNFTKVRYCLHEGEEGYAYHKLV